MTALIHFQQPPFSYALSLTLTHTHANAHINTHTNTHTRRKWSMWSIADDVFDILM